jgi:hypothetical protein
LAGVADRTSASDASGSDINVFASNASSGSKFKVTTGVAPCTAATHSAAIDGQSIEDT